MLKLELVNVVKRFANEGEPVIRGLSTTVAEGQMLVLLGPSGCGKTTLMRSIVGVQKVAGGEITVLGHPAGSRLLRRSHNRIDLKIAFS